MMPLKPSLSKMNSIERLKGMLGLASKAGSLIFGTEPVSEAVMELYEGKLIIKNDVDSGYSE